MDNVAHKGMFDCAFNALKFEDLRTYLLFSLFCSLLTILLTSFAFAQAANNTSICFNNAQGFAQPTIYYWNPSPDTGNIATINWPGVALQQEGEFYCHDIGESPDSINVIFSNNGEQQTADLQMLADNRCYLNAQWQTLATCGLANTTPQEAPITVYFKNDTNYANPYLHYFDLAPTSPNSNWPGVAMQAIGDDWYSFEFQVPIVSGGIVFNNNGGEQTADLVLDPSKPCYQNNSFVSLDDCAYSPNPTLNYPTGNAIFLVNSLNWETPTAYLWNAVPDGSIANSNWPGEALEAVGENNVFFLEIGASAEQGSIIFSNQGGQQTADLEFTQPRLCYHNGNWVTPEECGVPTQEKLVVGNDRKANQGSRLALTLPANDNVGNVTWQSNAWANDLVGNSVVTPALQDTGNFIVTVSQGELSNEFNLEVVSPVQALPERPELAKPLNFPTSGNISQGNYEFEVAFPNIADKFASPVQVLNDGLNDLIYVVDKPGSIWVFPNEVNVEDAQVIQLLDIRDEVRDNHEQGFISMAFHPDFAQNGFAYIYYIEGENDEPSSGNRFDDGVLQRITLNSTSSPTGIEPNSRVDVLRVPQVGNDHKGGKMEFHPASGLFYMSFGDGAYAATAGDPVDPSDPRKNNSAQETDNLRGSFIRLEMLASPENGQYYRIPSDNPFVGNNAVRDEIWSYGHRNPWRWSFQQVEPYTLWQTEVGQAGFEEVNIIEPGKNYGWPICEGTTHRGQAGGDPDGLRSCAGDLEGPVDGYLHSTGSVSIIGGVVYNGNALPALRGKFLFGDYISKNIWTIEQGQTKELLSDGFPSNIVSFGTDLSGDQVLVSTYGFEFGVSGIYRIVDREAAATVIPSTLSQTGIFADLEEQFPVSGVIEYQVNSQPWFDGAQMRFFVSLANGDTINFSPDDVWSLPVGSVVIKHLSTAIDGNNSKPFETSVLFRQTSVWEAANYRWNSDGSEADLVTTTHTESVTEFIDGSAQAFERTVRAGPECGSCHSGVGGKNPRGLKTQQLNREFSQQGVSGNQLNVFNRIGLFNEVISDASNYQSYVNPADTDADINERARVYLDTNCASCHGGSLMNLNYATPLLDMDIMNRRLAGDQFRMLPFDHTRSVLHTFQVSDNNRMPRGTSTSNSVADDLFRQWINAPDAVLVSQQIETSLSTQDIRVGESLDLQLVRNFNNDFEQRNFDLAGNTSSSSIIWASSNSNIIDVSGLQGGSITITPLAIGQTTISVSFDGTTSTLTLSVSAGVSAPTNFIASGLTSSSISLHWTPSNDQPSQITGYSIERANNTFGPFTNLVDLSADSSNFIDSGLSPSTRYYYQIRAINANASSAAVDAFADTLASSNIDTLHIETGNSFTLLEGEKRQLIAVAEVNQQLQGVTLSANWFSDNSNVISISASGLITGGPDAGTATITASFGGESSNIQLLNQGPGSYLYFNNQSTNWPAVNAYVFATTNGTETPQSADWPGSVMESSIEYGGKWQRFALRNDQFGQQQTEVVFNCGNAECKTEDLIINTNTPAQWYDDGQWLSAEPIGAGATTTGTQLIINNGEITWASNGDNLTGRLISPGALVDINANEVGIGQQFEQWEGSAAPYILNPTSPNTQMLVPPALSLTMNGVFASITDLYASGRDYYRSSQASCVGCHGVEGQGSPVLTNLISKYTLQELTDYIEQNMPLGNISECTGECASEIASMLLAEAFTAPAGTCDFDDLNDMVPTNRSNRLLTLYEYNNSVRDILGLEVDVDVTSGNLPATIPLNGFKTAANTVFTDEYAQGYVNAAADVADLIADDLFSLSPDCASGGSLSCAIESAGKRIFRRPLLASEVAELTSVHSLGGERAVIISLFSSPAMLYRSEVGTLIDSGNQQGYYQLSAYEIASMLSYTFWGTTPDSWLMQLADTDALNTNQKIKSTVEQMLDDPRSAVAFERFINGWLDLEENIGSPQLNNELKSDMKEETIRFVKNVVFDNGSYTDLMTANYSVMTQRLAEHYGLPWPGGNDWQQVFYSGNDNNERRGILGHAGILTIQSAQEKTHPVKRGLFVRKNLMCQEFPPPPLGAALNAESDPSQGVRHRFETAHAQPGCDTCHQYIDGIGFGLESYNSFGQFVTTELSDNGTTLAINANGYIGSLESAETFLSDSGPVIDYQGLDQLSQLISDSSHGKSCFARQWFRYANGRRETSDDSCTVQGFSNTFKTQEHVSLKDLIIEFTQTPNYTLRK